MYNKRYFLWFLKKQKIQLNANIVVQNIQFVMVINTINKDIFVKKHEAKQ